MSDARNARDQLRRELEKIDPERLGVFAQHLDALGVKNPPKWKLRELLAGNLRFVDEAVYPQLLQAALRTNAGEAPPDATLGEMVHALSLSGASRNMQDVIEVLKLVASDHTANTLAFGDSDEASVQEVRTLLTRFGGSAGWSWWRHWGQRTLNDIGAGRLIVPLVLMDAVADLSRGHTTTEYKRTLLIELARKAGIGT